MRKAFTIVELTVAISVIGLIISAIFVGNSLVKSSTLRNIIKEQEQYKTAIDNFKTTYNAVPGDMVNASVLGTVSGSGNGNGIVDTTSEKFYMPQHLQVAGFISGNYNGTNQLILAYDKPNSWSYVAFAQTIFNLWRANEINFLYYNKGTSSNNGSISPIDASNIDNKIDDGNASTGYVLAMSTSSSYNCIKSINGTGANQISTYTGTDANYDLKTKSKECELLFGQVKSN